MHCIATGRAFATATGLLGTGSLVLGTGLVYAFDISSFEDFSHKLRGSMQRAFPSLKGRYTLEEEQEAGTDTDSLEFIKEWEREIRAPPLPPSQMETLLQTKVRNGLPFRSS